MRANFLTKTDHRPISGKGCVISTPLYLSQSCNGAPHILNQAQRKIIDPDLLAAITLQESDGSSKAYSHSEAVGMVQNHANPWAGCWINLEIGPVFFQQACRARTA
jgi:hypothetical protein